MEENKHIYNAFDNIKEAILVSLWKDRHLYQIIPNLVSPYTDIHLHPKR